jgi:hypothetical protein
VWVAKPLTEYVSRRTLPQSDTSAHETAQGALANTRADDGLRAGSVRAVIDGRFSPKAFEASEDAEALAATLREEVVLAIQPAIQAAMKAVIGQLNSLGA